MTDREKLIELLETVPHAQRLYPDLYVDHLIANGVTVPVRCKDCKHLGVTYGEYWCDRTLDSHPTDKDNFCSYGERKKDD